MLIEKEVTKYTINEQESIRNALQKIVDMKGRIVFAVTDMGVLEGLFTNGDFLRWVVEHGEIDLNLPVSHILNRNFIYAYTTDTPEKLEAKLTPKILFVPILDERRRLVAVARQR